ncbi:hypothetical protein HPB52_005620 [Rhipicephalus sanguineus]|uniref:Uncharacterized protein n=2 Tax=Rhipicephalus sanguineus TaxID=34632 RepID=A0A9D4PHI3_RHISA|nr:hypothetical protein HPB52_005620 [Rhipicephalus sanguineus]
MSPARVATFARLRHARANEGAPPPEQADAPTRAAGPELRCAEGCLVTYVIHLVGRTSAAPRGTATWIGARTPPRAPIQVAVLEVRESTAANTDGAVAALVDQSQNKPNSDQELVGGSPAEAVGWQVKRSKRAQKRLRKERAEDSQTSIPSSRKKTANSPPERPAGLPGAFVYGDGNARRLKRAVLQASAWHRGVHCRTKKDATLVETMEAIETATDVWDSTEAIVVLHAGLSDIQDDTSPHDSTERLKSQITSWKARAKGHFFVVYGVPEVGPKDDTMRIKCELWNQNLRQICSDIGTRVEFVSVTKALQDKMNGTSYSEYVAEQLGQRLGRRLCAFLGLRPSGNHKHRAWSVKPTTSMMTALGQAILQMANPQRWQKRSWHRT